MKRFIVFLAVFVINIQTIHAKNVIDYFDKGEIYSGSSFPVDAAKNAENNLPVNSGLKRGEATVNNILGLVETGNRGIQTAAKNGEITRIHYVDNKVSKVYIPILFIPIYVKQTKTIVYGE